VNGSGDGALTGTLYGRGTQDRISPVSTHGGDFTAQHDALAALKIVHDPRARSRQGNLTGYHGGHPRTRREYRRGTGRRGLRPPEGIKSCWLLAQN
jgi:hypothetical protein